MKIGGREWKQYLLFDLFLICFHVPFLFHSFYDSCFVHSTSFLPTKSTFSVYLCFLEQNCVSMHKYLILECWPFQVNVEQDDLDEMDLQEMEEARKAYMAAVGITKERQDEESIAAAANARLHLQSFVFKSKDFNL